jgi:hypothetical protein
VPDLNDIFDNIYILIPVALFIFLRVFADALQKRNQAGESTRNVAKAVKRKPRPASFLSKLRDRFTGLSSHTRAPREPLDYEVSELPRYERPAVKHTTHAVPRRLVVETAKAAGGARTGVQSATMGSEKTDTASVSARPRIQGIAYPSPFPAAVERLPPLQKAFTMTVVLGKPKSLED